MLLLGLLFSPEDGWDMFLQNIGWLSLYYIALYPRRHNSSDLSVLLKQKNHTSSILNCEKDNEMGPELTMVQVL
jgi:hypothetical protein